MGFMSTMPAFGGDQPQGPQMGFGLDPATGLPFGQDGMQAQPMQQQPQAQLQPLPAGLPTVGMGGGKGMPMQPAPQVGNMPNAGLNPPQQLPQGPQMGFGMPPGQQPQDLMQSLTRFIGGGGGVAYQPQGPQMGFGMPPQQPANQVSAPSGGYNSPVRTQLPQQAPQQAQPINRFAPPNAPGVRPGANRYTRNRLR